MGLPEKREDEDQRGDGEAYAQAMAERRQNGTFRMQPGYDHSYFFVSTFMPDHLRFHALQLFA